MITACKALLTKPEILTPLITRRWQDLQLLLAPHLMTTTSQDHQTIVLSVLSQIKFKVVTELYMCYQQAQGWQQVASFQRQAEVVIRLMAPWLPYPANWCMPRWLRLTLNASTGAVGRLLKSLCCCASFPDHDNAF